MVYFCFWEVNVEVGIVFFGIVIFVEVRNGDYEVVVVRFKCKMFEIDEINLGFG